MNDKQRESLSAFLDGELNDPEAIESLVRQSGCKQAFAALCQQRDALHGQINGLLPAGFAEQVADAVAEEPTVFSPGAARSSAPVIEAKGELVQGWFGGRSPSLAIAASVAALGFVGLVMFSQGGDTESALMAKSSAGSGNSLSSPLLAVAPDLSVRQDAVRPVTSDVRSIDFNSLSPQLRAQLIRHINALRAAGPSNISYQTGN